MKKLQRLVIIFLLMFKIGAFTFGGGWSIIAQIQAEFVDRRGWMTEDQIADYMSFAKSFPGIMIINMSVFLRFCDEWCQWVRWQQLLVCLPPRCSRLRLLRISMPLFVIISM